jgi:iron complex transport system substrate-binding protein
MKKYQFIILIALLGCKEKNTEQNHLQENKSETTIKYAEGFRAKYYDTFKEVEVTYPFQGATSGYKYLLVPRDQKIPKHDPSTRVIRIPVQSIVCTSTTHIPLLDYLNETDKLVGFPTTDYISSEKMRKRIDEGKVQDLGIDKGLNIEQLVMLKPDLIMGYTVSSDYGQFKKIEELGMSVVINSEYLEKHPLGRAEWIKFTALFFNKEKEADSVFNEIEKNYLQTKSLADGTKNKPSVLSGIVYGDSWFLPGGQNNVSKLLKDAGCKYLWEDDSSHGFLQLSFESVYAKAKQADIWIGVGDFRTLEDLKNADDRYTAFKPFVNHTVYNYDARKGAKGGSEFMELGYLRTDIIIKDLVKIAHPELLPDYQLYFHRKLE